MSFSALRQRGRSRRKRMAAAGAGGPQVSDTQWLIDTNTWGDGIPADWSALIGTDVWSVQQDSQDAGRVALVGNPGNEGDRVLAWDRAASGIDTELELELHLRFRVLDYQHANAGMCGAASAVLSAAPNNQYISGRLWWHPNELFRGYLSYKRASDGGSGASSTADIWTGATAASTILNLRAHIAADPGGSESRTFQIRIWRDSDTEPASYQDSQSVTWDWTPGGDVGFMSVSEGQFEYLTLGIGVDGSPAPAPS